MRRDRVLLTTLLLPINAARSAIPWVPSYSQTHVSNVKFAPWNVNANQSLDVAAKDVAPTLLHYAFQTSTAPTTGDGTTRSDSSKLVNPILLVILVISVVLVAVLTFIYLIKKHGSAHQRQENALDPLTFHPSGSGASRPPAYEEAVKTSRPSVCDIMSAPPPSYEEVQQYGTDGLYTEPHGSSRGDIRK